MKLAFLLIALSLPASAAPKWLRWAVPAALCAASAYDGWTTAQAKSAGFREGNPLLRSADGSPALGRISLVKAAGCGVAVWRAKAGGNASAWTSLGIAAGYVAVGERNRRLVK